MGESTVVGGMEVRSGRNKKKNKIKINKIK